MNIYDEFWYTIDSDGNKYESSFDEAYYNYLYNNHIYISPWEYYPEELYYVN